MGDTSDEAAQGTDQCDQTMQQKQGTEADAGTGQPVINTPAPSPVPTAPAGNFDQDMNHLMIHLGDLKAFLARWEHNAGRSRRCFPARSRTAIQAAADFIGTGAIEINISGREGCRLHLRTQPPQVAPGAPSRRTISAAHQPVCDEDPAKLWKFYIQLVEIEASFKNLKDDLQLRPIHHQLEHRIEAHIFVAFLAYCLHVTLRAQLKPLAPGLTPRAVLDKMAAIQMLDVHFPTTDGRTLILRRYTKTNH